MTATALEALKSSALAAGSIPLEIRSPAGLSEWLAALSAVLAAAVIGYATYLSSKRQAEATRSTNKENLAEQERRHQQDLELQEWKYLHAYQTARADEARKLLHEIVCEFQDMIVDRLNKPKEYFETLDVVEKYKSTSKTVNMKFNTMRTCLDSVCLPRRNLRPNYSQPLMLRGRPKCMSPTHFQRLRRASTTSGLKALTTISWLQSILNWVRHIGLGSIGRRKPWFDGRRSRVTL